MATDEVRARGAFDLFRRGSFTNQYVAVAFSLSGEQSDFGGSALIYDGNPIAIFGSGHLDPFGDQSEARFVSGWFGTFEDFTIDWGAWSGDAATSLLNRQGDPTGAWFIRETEDPASATGASDTPWNRVFRTVMPPKGARYVVPTVNFEGLPSGDRQYFDEFQVALVPAPLGTSPSSSLPATPDYVKPRTLTSKVVPTRLNYSIRPIFERVPGDATAPSGVAGIATPTAYAPAALSRVGKRLHVTTSGAHATWVYEDQGIAIVPGEPLTLSYTYATTAPNLGGARYPITPAIRFYNQANDLISTVTGTPILLPTRAGRASVTAEAPVGTEFARVYLLFQNIAGSGADYDADDVYISNVLIEKSRYVGTFFAGSYDDCLWRQNEDPYNTWSYYYEDRADRHYILVRCLEENVPLGVSVADPEYALSGVRLNAAGNAI